MFPEYVYREANAHKTAYARFTTKGSDSEKAKILVYAPKRPVSERSYPTWENRVRAKVCAHLVRTTVRQLAYTC